MIEQIVCEKEAGQNARGLRMGGMWKGMTALRGREGRGGWLKAAGSRRSWGLGCNLRVKVTKRVG